MPLRLRRSLFSQSPIPFSRFFLLRLLLAAGKEDARRLAALKQQLTTNTAVDAALTQTDTASISGTTTGAQSLREQAKHAIENMLAADCLYCGEYMIESIDKPFIEDWAKVNLDWQ